MWNSYFYLWYDGIVKKPHHATVPSTCCFLLDLIHCLCRGFDSLRCAEKKLKSEIWQWRDICPMHCNENLILYSFSENCAASSSPNFLIHVSVSDFYIPRIGPHISCSRISWSIVGTYKSLKDKWLWKLGLWSCNSFSGNICFEFSVLVLCSVIAVLNEKGFLEVKKE